MKSLHKKANSGSKGRDSRTANLKTESCPHGCPTLPHLSSVKGSDLNALKLMSRTLLASLIHLELEASHG